MRRSPNPWPIGLREPNPAGVRETRAVAVMVGHSEEVGSGYANAGGERYLVISVAVRKGQGGIRRSGESPLYEKPTFGQVGGGWGTLRPPPAATVVARPGSYSSSWVRTRLLRLPDFQNPKDVHPVALHGVVDQAEVVRNWQVRVHLLPRIPGHALSQSGPGWVGVHGQGIVVQIFAGRHRQRVQVPAQVRILQ